MRKNMLGETWDALSFVVSYFWCYKLLIVLGCMLLILTTLLSIPVPLLTKYLVDEVLVSGNIDELYFIMLIITILVIFNFVANYYQGVVFVKANARIVFDIKYDLVKKLSRVKSRLYDKFAKGYLINRINQDTASLGTLLADSLFHVIQDLLVLLSGVILLLYINYQLAFICFVFMPVFVISLSAFSRKLYTLSHNALEKNAHLTGQLKETLELIPFHRLNSSESYNLTRFRQKGSASVDAIICQNKTSFLSGNITSFVAKYSSVFLTGAGCYLIITSDLTIGGLIAFSTYTSYVFNPIQRLANMVIKIQNSLAAFGRIQELRLLPEEESGRTTIDQILNLKASCLSFSYDRKEVLREVSFDVCPGDVVGIVGSSGAGKTTLMSLITGTNEIQQGSIEVNGISLEYIDKESYRRRIAVVDQEPCLFNDTILNNILVSDEDCSERRLDELKEGRRLLKDIGENGDLSMKLDDQGCNLSTGQKQRISIVRALLKDSDVLILDEPTSNIDEKNVTIVLEMIRCVCKEKITFLITHDSDELSHCNKIITLE